MNNTKELMAKLKAAAEKAKDDFRPNVVVSTRDVLELIAALEAAEKRNAGLEARAVKLPDNCEHDVMAPVASFMYEDGYEFDGEDYSALAGRVRSELETVLRRSLRAAGINLETGGE
ncbi:hypothetical protein BN136_3683 [Cronobacter universalis NCTC 9529]|uniref:Ead/Ea22-like family protein n=1 Tax=Cronobacter universalis NCTC 9529 TaxID=1074000 RepID=A0AAC8VPY9_9ENTR|nr:hypothetical protein [Cronobacter universalis]ALB54853.1 hypothetical protein AFK65_09320 [Cronobacter universalis NCTC 9529]CCK17673.1 hypothetical protein BN136_3683 [Cronobacter universalis NCTC 9529]STD07050.1 Uncharacterised protein [Cronobacter universalis NCTC 9529]